MNRPREGLVVSISASVARPLDHETHAGAGGAGGAGADQTVIAADALRDVAGAAIVGANGAASDITPDADAGTDAKPTPAGDPAPDASAATHPNMFASAVWLMMASPKHRHLFVADLQWRLIPPLMLRQFRLFQKDGKPTALATWAMVSDEVAARLGGTDGGGTSGEGGTPRSDLRLKPAEWRSGTMPILVDVVAPFGNAEAVAKFVRETVWAKLDNNVNHPGVLDSDKA